MLVQPNEPSNLIALSRRLDCIATLCRLDLTTAEAFALRNLLALSCGLLPENDHALADELGQAWLWFPDQAEGSNEILFHARPALDAIERARGIVQRRIERAKEIGQLACA